MDETASALSRLEVLEARAAIADLVHRYARAVHAGDAAECTSLFAADGSFTVLGPAADAGGARPVRVSSAGREALRRFYDGALQAGENCPLVHNLIVDVRGDEASSTCVMAGAAPDGKPMFMGAYVDRYRREHVWLFTSRTFTLFA